MKSEGFSTIAIVIMLISVCMAINALTMQVKRIADKMEQVR